MGPVTAASPLIQGVPKKESKTCCDLTVLRNWVMKSNLFQVIAYDNFK